MAEARDLIKVIVNDQDLPRFVRQEAGRLLPVVASEPELALGQLEDLRSQILPDLALWPPECDYARCVSIATFWRFHVAAAVRHFFRHPSAYQQHLEAQADPALVARGHLPDGVVLIPSKHSWLVPFDLIAGLNGIQTKALLKVEQRPPYLVMIFPVEQMRATGVSVREPRGIDAVPKRLTQWASGDVPGERIDKDIPAAALGGLQWRP